MKDLDKKITKLEQRKARLEKELKIFRHQHSAQGRKAHGRRMFLIGQAVTAAVEAKIMRRRTLEKILEKFVTKERDREFLGLELLPSPPQTLADNAHVLASLKHYVSGSEDENKNASGSKP